MIFFDRKKMNLIQIFDNDTVKDFEAVYTLGVVSQTGAIMMAATRNAPHIAQFLLDNGIEKILFSACIDNAIRRRSWRFIGWAHTNNIPFTVEQIQRIDGVREESYHTVH